MLHIAVLAALIFASMSDAFVDELIGQASIIDGDTVEISRDAHSAVGHRRDAGAAAAAATKSRRRAENQATASQHGHDTQPATNVSMHPK
jgi:hypothetical protein